MRDVTLLRGRTRCQATSEVKNVCGDSLPYTPAMPYHPPHTFAHLRGVVGVLQARRLDALLPHGRQVRQQLAQQLAAQGGRGVR